jgi:enoyl-CoA hydratase/carnithine racemase
MLCCDLVVAADHVVFGLAEVKRGLMPGGGGTLLATRIPMAVALEITLTGDTIDCARALELGLINRVVPQGTEVDEAVALAEKIAANGPLAVRVVKKLVRNGATKGGDTAWPPPKEIGAVFSSEDAREGALAFVEKRPPRFVGR